MRLRVVALTLIALTKADLRWARALESARGSCSAPGQTSADVDWKRYRIGDTVKTPRHWCRKLAPPGSLACYFCAVLDSYKEEHGATPSPRPPRHQDILCQLVSEFGSRQLPSAQPWEPPGERDLVVHVRLGDVLDEIHPDEMDDAWQYGVALVPQEIRNMIHGRGSGGSLGWWHYVTTLCDWKYIASQARARAARAARVVLVGSSVHGQRDNSSLKNTATYLDKIQTFLRSENFSVARRFDVGLPDDDFTWMAGSKTFAAGGGGYAALVGSCVEHSGGLVLDKHVTGSSTSGCRTARAPLAQRNRTYSWEAGNWRGRRGPWIRHHRSFPPEDPNWS